jgi:hypothetical protein
VTEPSFAIPSPLAGQGDALRAYRFETEIVHPAPSEIIDKVGLMEVTGLRATVRPGALLLARGVVQASPPLLYGWWRVAFSPNQADTGHRDLVITVDNGIEFHVKDAQPTDLTFNDLDSGGDVKYILMEYLRVEYRWIKVRYL